MKRLSFGDPDAKVRWVRTYRSNERKDVGYERREGHVIVGHIQIFYIGLPGVDRLLNEHVRQRLRRLFSRSLTKGWDGGMVGWWGGERRERIVTGS